MFLPKDPTLVFATGPAPR